LTVIDQRQHRRLEERGQRHPGGVDLGKSHPQKGEVLKTSFVL
jgi:hypothetical protein